MDKEYLNKLVEALIEADYYPYGEMDSREGNRHTPALFYFHKRRPDSNWEVYVSLNEQNGLLCVNYRDTYTKNEAHLVGLVYVNDETRLESALKLVEAKELSLWSPSLATARNHTPGGIRVILKRAHFEEVDSRENIFRFSVDHGGHSTRALVENGIKASVFFFRQTADGKDEKPLFVIRNIGEQASIESLNLFLASMPARVRSAGLDGTPPAGIKLS